ncbi:MAG: Holliday junction branch migration protein RuvA [Desulfotalea sp.]
MIAFIKGELLFKSTDRVVVDVAGVGYEIFLSTDALARIASEGEPIALYIHTSVREDAITLFGFLEAQEKELFLTLKTVSGIGPKLGLGILSGMPIDELSNAIASSDIKRLVTLPGVGKKTAERICVELKDKVGSVVVANSTSGGSSAIDLAAGAAFADALSALCNLGYADPVAREALARVKNNLGDQDATVEYLIREGLKVLA